MLLHSLAMGNPATTKLAKLTVLLPKAADGLASRTGWGVALEHLMVNQLAALHDHLLRLLFCALLLHMKQEQFTCVQA